ncbi:MAG: hypothetical protein GY811_15865, partial [Myxococcales bacterium]|nr:hypothetical protein [Myxococcales bacterium]
MQASSDGVLVLMHDTDVDRTTDGIGKVSDLSLADFQQIDAKRPKRPRPEQERVWASVMKPANEVIGEAFSEARLRDPDRTKQWVGLIDGNKPQLNEL